MRWSNTRRSCVLADQCGSTRLHGPRPHRRSECHTASPVASCPVSRCQALRPGPTRDGGHRAPRALAGVAPARNFRRVSRGILRIRSRMFDPPRSRGFRAWRQPRSKEETDWRYVVFSPQSQDGNPAEQTKDNADSQRATVPCGEEGAVRRHARIVAGYRRLTAFHRIVPSRGRAWHEGIKNR